MVLVIGGEIATMTRKRVSRSHKTLIRLCQRAVSSLPKSALNVMYAEYIFEDRFNHGDRKVPSLRTLVSLVWIKR